MRCKNGFKQYPPKSGNCIPKTLKLNSVKAKTKSPKELKLTKKNLILLKLRPLTPPKTPPKTRKNTNKKMTDKTRRNNIEHYYCI
jgi:hypothetical protein